MEVETMYDAVDVDNIPGNAVAVAGYVGGSWPTYPTLKEKFPDAHHVSIAVNASEDAHVLDIEKGDATPDEAPAWVHRQHQRGLKRPGLYIQASNLQALVDLLESHNVKRENIVLWSAHQSGAPHICGPHCGMGIKVTADATQYINTGAVDKSLVMPSFWP